MADSRQERIRAWLSNPYNAALALVIIASFAIRVYFYIQTQGQTLWWDEAEYMSAAKKWALDVPYELNPQRPPLFQILSALVFMLGLGEQFIKFALVLLPSTALVACFYYLGKEMFNEKVALVTAIFAAVSWTFLFWTTRAQPDFFSMCFQVLAVLFMWKHWKSPSAKFVIYSGIFAALGFYFKISALLVPMVFMVFIALKDRLAAFKDRHYYYFSGAFLATMIPYFIWSLATFGNPLAFRTGYVDAVSDFPIAWYNLNFYSFLTDSFLFMIFIVAVVFAFRFVLYLDVLAKDKSKMLNAEIFSIITMAFISAFYIFYQRNTDDRWVFLWLPFIFMISGNIIIKASEWLKRYHKFLAAGALFILVGLVAYQQLGHANSLIEDRFASYSPVKEAGLWVKDNYPKDTKLLSISYTQSVYYSEVNVSTYSRIESPDAFDAYLEATRPELLQWSVFEATHPAWITQWITDNAGRLKPVQAYFADAQRTQPILVVYEIEY